MCNWETKDHSIHFSRREVAMVTGVSWYHLSGENLAIVLEDIVDKM